MGLDTFGAKLDASGEKTTPLDSALFAHIPSALVGGLFSGHGSSNSFRGKVYDDFITYICDQTLYTELIPNIKVHQMVAALQHFVDENPPQKTLDKLDITWDEVLALLEWLKVVANSNGVIVGWW